MYYSRISSCCILKKDMEIDEFIKEKLQKLNTLNEQAKEDRKHLKLLSKASRTWLRLTKDRLNQKLGDC